MENGRQLRINLYARGVNETVVIDVQRGDRKLRSAGPGRPSVTNDAGRLSDSIAQQIPVRALGVLALEPDAQIVELLARPYAATKGAVVASVSHPVPYSQQGRLQPGDVIYSLNGKAIETVADLNPPPPKSSPAAPQSCTWSAPGR